MAYLSYNGKFLTRTGKWLGVSGLDPYNPLNLPPYTFGQCINVESGALALYQQMSTQATPPSITSHCFTNCSSQTVTGAQELAQIPTSWGGTMA